MQYKIDFQIMDNGSARPDDCSQDNELIFDDPIWIPNVGDSVSMQYGEKPRAFIVISRHFSIRKDFYFVNVVVRSALVDEISKRIKE